MGCDIHLFAETKNRETDEWEIVPAPIVTCWRCEGTGITEYTGSAQPCYGCAEPMTTELWYDGEDYVERPCVNARYVEPGRIREGWYDERNYYVFACLADVRNHDVEFSKDFTTYVVDPIRIWSPIISEPRGLPEGVTKEAHDYLADDGDIHSVSWLGLEEILAFEWPKQPDDDAGHDRSDRYAYFMAAMKMLAVTTGEAPTRIVYGFDN